MNGIEKITQLIESEVQTEIDAILTKAREESDAILVRYQSQADAEAADLKQKSLKAAAEREERMISVAQMESRKVTLQVKQEMVEKAYELACYDEQDGWMFESYPEWEGATVHWWMPLPEPPAE